jgi:diguanylate cyclase (GGDEF)-like protein
MNVRPRVVIVDDVPGNIKILHDILGEDYDVFFAIGGVEGLALVEEQLPDLVLLDILMPGMDGYEVCARIKANPRTASIPVIFVTAMDEVDDEAKGLAMGAIDYITKPLSAGIVRARVRNHVELKRSRDVLERLSTTDGLTGIANRRRFDEYSAFQWQQSMRTGVPLSIVFADIDYFKDYNDLYGHVAGDKCLKQVAGAAAGVVARSLDLVARYGGEELVCVLPGTDATGAQMVSNKILGFVNALAIPHARSQVADHVTVSIGVATCVPAIGKRLSALLESADEALYEAKQAGRNRVVRKETA